MTITAAQSKNCSHSRATPPGARFGRSELVTFNSSVSSTAAAQQQQRPMPETTDWRPSAPEEGEYAFMLFHSNAQATTQYPPTQTQFSAPCDALSDDDMLDEIFQEIMTPGPQDHEPQAPSDLSKGFEMASSSPLFSHVLTPSSAPSTPQLTSSLRRGSIPSATLGSISPNMAAALRVPTFPVNHSAVRNTTFFPMLTDPKVRINTGLGAFGAHHTAMLFTSPTAASRRCYRRTNRPSRLQKKKPASRICRMAGCTKGIRSRGLCKAHGGGRRCTTPGCEISDQGGGHCIAHGGGRRCSISGCQKSAQSKGLCKLHGGARLCRLPDCNKNGQIKGLCRLHYSVTMATKSASAVPTTSVAMKLEPHQMNRSPCEFELRV